MSEMSTIAENTKNAVTSKKSCIKLTKTIHLYLG